MCDPSQASKTALLHYSKSLHDYTLGLWIESRRASEERAREKSAAASQQKDAASQQKDAVSQQKDTSPKDNVAVQTQTQTQTQTQMQEQDVLLQPTS